MNYDPLAAKILVGVRNQLTSLDQIELLLPDATIRLDATQMTDLYGAPIREVHNSYQVYLPVNQEVPLGAIIRKVINNETLQ
jgi:hypothetical protein